MYKNFLKQLGLSDQQSDIYHLLLQRGALPARKISLETSIPRTLCYKILEDMLKEGVVYKEIQDIGVAKFLPSSPAKLQNLINKKKEEVDILNASFEAVQGPMNAEWNRMWGKPSISLYEGIDGLKNIYDDILHSGQKEIYVISSPVDKDEGVKDLIKRQIISQSRKGIKTKAITPLDKEYVPATRIEEDRDNLIERKKIDQKELPIPAQIIIYGDKVSITNFSNNVTNFVINNSKAADSLRMIFNLLWSKI